MQSANYWGRLHSCAVPGCDPDSVRGGVTVFTVFFFLQEIFSSGKMAVSVGNFTKCVLTSEDYFNKCIPTSASLLHMFGLILNLSDNLASHRARAKV